MTDDPRPGFNALRDKMLWHLKVHANAKPENLAHGLANMAFEALGCPTVHGGKTLGQIAHEAGERAGRWARKWSDLGDGQRAEWEEIGAAAARAALAAPKTDAWHFTQDSLFPPPGEEVLVWSQQPWEKEPSMKLDRWAEQHEAPVEWSSKTIPVGLGWDSHDDPFGVIAWMLPTPPTPPAHQGATHHE